MPVMPGPLSGYPDDNPKTQYGDGKPQMQLVPPVVLVHMGEVMRLGAEKYGPYNWRERTVSSSVYAGAMHRHLAAWYDGEDLDPESGAPHLAHIMACAAILLDAQSIDRLNDDRPSPGESSRVIRFYEKARRDPADPEAADPEDIVVSVPAY